MRSRERDLVVHAETLRASPVDQKFNQTQEAINLKENPFFQLGKKQRQHNHNSSAFYQTLPEGKIKPRTSYSQERPSLAKKQPIKKKMETITYKPYQRTYGKYRLPAKIPTYDFDRGTTPEKTPSKAKLNFSSEDIFSQAQPTSIKSQRHYVSPPSNQYSLK